MFRIHFPLNKLSGITYKRKKRSDAMPLCRMLCLQARYTKLLINSFGEVSLHTSAGIVSCRFHITASWDWLFAWPSLRVKTIDDKAVRVAVGLRIDLDCVLHITLNVVFLLTLVVCTALMAKYSSRQISQALCPKWLGCSLLCLSRYSCCERACIDLETDGLEVARSHFFCKMLSRKKWRNAWNKNSSEELPRSYSI